MSLYNALFGMNSNAKTILATLGLSPDDCGRFRDCFVANGEIAVYTRNGGGNREEYQSTFDRLSGHPCYLRDEDDGYDETYATVYFRFPDEFADDLKALDSNQAVKPSDKWEALIKALNGGK